MRKKTTKKKCVYQGGKFFPGWIGPVSSRFKKPEKISGYKFGINTSSVVLPPKPRLPKLPSRPKFTTQLSKKGFTNSRSLKQTHQRTARKTKKYTRKIDKRKKSINQTQRELNRLQGKIYKKTAKLQNNGLSNNLRKKYNKKLKKYDEKSKKFTESLNKNTIKLQNSKKKIDEYKKQLQEKKDKVEKYMTKKEERYKIKKTQKLANYQNKIQNNLVRKGRTGLWSRSKYHIMSRLGPKGRRSRELRKKAYDPKTGKINEKRIERIFNNKKKYKLKLSQNNAYLKSGESKNKKDGINKLLNNKTKTEIKTNVSNYRKKATNIKYKYKKDTKKNSIYKDIIKDYISDHPNFSRDELKHHVVNEMQRKRNLKKAKAEAKRNAEKARIKAEREAEESNA